MLESAQIENVIISPSSLHQSLELAATAIYRERTEVTVDIAQGASDVANQLDQIVLVDVDDMQHARAALENLAYNCLSDRARAPDDKKPRVGDLIGHLSAVIVDILLKKRPATADQIEDIHHILHALGIPNSHSGRLGRFT